MDKFYVNCALSEDVNISSVKVTKKYYDEKLKSYLSLLPLSVVKISYDGKHCYAQLRVASELYMNRFNKYITFSSEKKTFEESNNRGLPILFISEHYRNLLGIEIIQCVKDMNDLNFNEKCLTISPPKNLGIYFWYILMTAYNHPELYSFFMFLIAIFGLISAIISGIFPICSFIVFIFGCFLLSFALIIPTQNRGIRFPLILVCVSIIILFLQKQPLICLSRGHFL